MLKKIMAALLLLAAVGCAGEPAAQAENTADEEIVFTRDDLCLYSESDDGVYYPIVWLGMDIREADGLGEYEDCFGENDLTYRPAVSADGEQTECVKFINYNGGTRRGLSTIKGIYSTGLYLDPENPSSRGEEIVKRYGLDPEKELIYSDRTDDENYSITLNFGTNDDGEFVRFVSTADEPVNTGDEKVKYMLKFLVVDGYVSDIQMIEK